MYTCTYTHTHKCTYVYTHVHIQSHTHNHTHQSTHMHTHTHSCIYIYVCIHTFEQSHVYMDHAYIDLNNYVFIWMSQESGFASPLSANPHPRKHPSWKEDILQTPLSPYRRKRSCKLPQPLKPLLEGRDLETFLEGRDLANPLSCKYIYMPGCPLGRNRLSNRSSWRVYIFA